MTADTTASNTAIERHRDRFAGVTMREVDTCFGRPTTTMPLDCAITSK